MTTTRTIPAKSPTTDLLERLSGVRFTHHGNEVQPWLDAARVAGIEAPREDHRRG